MIGVTAAELDAINELHRQKRAEHQAQAQRFVGVATPPPIAPSAKGTSLLELRCNLVSGKALDVEDDDLPS